MGRAINCKTGSELRVTTMIFANIFSDAAVYNNTVNITYCHTARFLVVIVYWY